MPRPPRDYAEVLAEAKRFEPRLSRAFRRSIDKMRASVSINDLAMRLAAKDVRGALALFPVVIVKDALSPAATIVRDAILRGGRVGATLLNAARKGQ